jgi:hypothetical protein
MAPSVALPATWLQKKNKVRLHKMKKVLDDPQIVLIFPFMADYAERHRE